MNFTQIMLEINEFAEKHFVTISIEFHWKHIRLLMQRGNNKQYYMLSNVELNANLDVVKITLENMLSKIEEVK